MTGFARLARFAGLYQTPLNIGQRGDCLGQWLIYHKVTVNRRASPAPQSQARGQAFPSIKKLCNTYSKLLLCLLYSTKQQTEIDYGQRSIKCYRSC